MKYIKFFYTKNYDYIIKNITYYYNLYIALNDYCSNILVFYLSLILMVFALEFIFFVLSQSLIIKIVMIIFLIATIFLGISIYSFTDIYINKILKLKEYILYNHIFTQIIYLNKFKNEDEYIKTCKDIFSCVFEPLSSSCYNEHKEYETVKSNILHEIGINLSAFFNVKKDYKFSFSYSDGKTYLYRKNKIYSIKW